MHPVSSCDLEHLTPVTHVPSTLHFPQVPHLGASLVVQLYLLSAGVRSLHLIFLSLHFSFWIPSQRMESLSAPVQKPGSLLLFPPMAAECLPGLVLLLPYILPHGGCVYCLALPGQCRHLTAEIQFINPSIPGAQHRAQGPIGAYWKVCYPINIHLTHRCVYLQIHKLVSMSPQDI